jgi:hypothetical protein
LIEAARLEFVKSGKRFSYIPLLSNNRDFVSTSTTADLSDIVSEDYLNNLRGNLQVLRRGRKAPDLCMLAGDLASLPSVQSLLQQFVAGVGCPLVIATPDVGILACKGAVGLALREIPVYETFPRQLKLPPSRWIELLVAGDGGENFLELIPELRRGQDFAPWTRCVNLARLSVKQTGLFISVYENLGPMWAFRRRECLFAVAIAPPAVHESYSFQTRVDRNCNIDFQLRYYDDSPIYGIHANIHLSNAGIIDLREGNFVGSSPAIRRDWLLKEHVEGTTSPTNAATMDSG